MAKNLHILLTNIKKLSNNPPMMNPLSVESYNQFLLEKIKKNTKEELETEIENDSFF